MDQEQTQMILNYLDKVASKLGTTVEHVWPWFVRQQYVDAFYCMAFFIIFSLAFYFFFLYSLRVEKWEGTLPHLVLAFLTIATGLGFVFSFVFFICEFVDVFNPEYAALKDLLSMAKQ